MMFHPDLEEDMIVQPEDVIKKEKYEEILEEADLGDSALDLEEEFVDE